MTVTSEIDQFYSEKYIKLWRGSFSLKSISITMSSMLSYVKLWPPKLPIRKYYIIGDRVIKAVFSVMP